MDFEKLSNGALEYTIKTSFLEQIYNASSHKELFEFLNESFEKGEITQEQLSFAIKQNEGFFTEQHIHRSLVGLANELILKTNKHEL